jgi:hypothetical protein
MKREVMTFKKVKVLSCTKGKVLNCILGKGRTALKVHKHEIIWIFFLT